MIMLSNNNLYQQPHLPYLFGQALTNSADPEQTVPLIKVYTIMGHFILFWMSHQLV